MVASSTEASDRGDSQGSNGDPGSDRGRSADTPSEIPKEGWKDVAERIWGHMKKDHTQLLSSGVAFWAFLSLFPAIVAAITIFGLVMGPEEVTRQLESFLEAVPSESRDLLRTQLESVAASSSTALGIGLVTSLAGALWAASTGMANMMEAINIVYDETDDRNWFQKRGTAVLLTLGAIVFVVLTLVGIAAVPHLVEATGLPSAVQFVLTAAVWPLLAAIFAVGLAVLYRYAPDRDNAEWSWISWGAGIAVVIWAVASILFQIYAASFGNYQETYGALAAVVVLLLWLMITSLSVLIGAHFNAEVEAQTATDTTQGEPEPMGQRGANKADNLGEAPVDGDDEVDLRDQRSKRTEEHVR